MAQGKRMNKEELGNELRKIHNAIDQEKKKSLTASEIADITGKKSPTVRKQARKENWKHETHNNGKEKKYLVESLPENIKELVEKTDVEEIKAPKPEAYYQELRAKEIKEVLSTLSKKSVILMGKAGVGKTHTIKIINEKLRENHNVVFFPEPPTPKTMLLSLAPEKSEKCNKDELIQAVEQKNKPVYLVIDHIEKLTPSAIQALDYLLGIENFRFLGAGHLGGKKKFNSTWMKCKGIFIKPLCKSDAIKLINELWAEEKPVKKVIAEKSKGIPRNIIQMTQDAKQGIDIADEVKYLDFTPIIIIISIFGASYRVIGWGYGDTETYILGGILAAVFMGFFWIYRGYVAGWWGTTTQKKEHNNL